MDDPNLPQVERFFPPGCKAVDAGLLASATHDLRQPLQSLALLQGLFAREVEGVVLERLSTQLAETVGVMSGLLNRLLDISQGRSIQDPPPGPAPVLAGSEVARQVEQPIPTKDGYVVFLVDDDRAIRDALRLLLEKDGRVVEDFATGEAFLAAQTAGVKGCLLLDASLPGIGGVELLQTLRAAGDTRPAIVITGNSDVPMAVRAMKAGAADFIEKPIAAADLCVSIDRALERSQDTSKQIARQANAAEHVAGLTTRQHQIMDLVLAGQPSKNIAIILGISQRTVESHRASIMRKMGTKSLPALVRLALAAAVTQ